MTAIGHVQTLSTMAQRDAQPPTLPRAFSGLASWPRGTTLPRHRDGSSNVIEDIVRSDDHMLLADASC